ncbi:uncharacterized protein JN550_002855 [Neoarthrinium moseri]|uniref:uncharacterized protein n=1 Tax=Neoarthrinium moseri TaxID=1658444 RepID=UPI001FDC4822|nr:uncharacterized protein JN550_002855 [Neoarthrinium moseri]KAI1874276.1 hypothetical protein JN550_002855 [Neoarthrinium moseri]
MDVAMEDIVAQKYTTPLKKGPKKKPRKTIQQCFPRNGFEYPDGDRIFQNRDNGHLFKRALMAVIPTLRQVVDEKLAELFIAAKKHKKLGGGILHTQRFEPAAQDVDCFKDLPKNIINHVMLVLLHARFLHIKFSEYRPNPVDPAIEGKTAKAIDAYTGKSPAQQPDDAFKDMEPKLIADMMTRMKAKRGPDWGDDKETTGAGLDASNAIFENMAQKLKEMRM